jgi:hypothetical protein
MQSCLREGAAVVCMGKSHERSSILRVYRLLQRVSVVCANASDARARLSMALYS